MIFVTDFYNYKYISCLKNKVNESTIVSWNMCIKIVQTVFTRVKICMFTRPECDRKMTYYI